MPDPRRNRYTGARNGERNAISEERQWPKFGSRKHELIEGRLQ
jgi:hypothetical protein